MKNNNPNTKTTNPSSEAMVRSGTGTSPWDGTLDKSLPSTHAKIWRQNQLEEPAKVEADLLCGLSDGSPFSSRPRLLQCFGPASLITLSPRFVWPTVSDPGLGCLSPFPQLPTALLFSAAAQASQDPLAAATIWPLDSQSLRTILKDAGGETLTGS